jgi:hypothetical protein
VVKGVALRMGIEWNVHRVLSPLGRDQQAGHRSHFCDRKAGDGERASLFVEYAGDYPESGSPAQLLNSGGLYRPGPNQQLDFHVALGLNHNAPSYIVGVGYSVGFDELF